MQQLLAKIKEYNTIIIHGHQRPDGDCYGSQLGLKNIIASSFKNKKVYVVGGLCNYVSFLGKMDEVTDEMYQGALVITVDTPTQERLDDKRINLGDYIIKIDHHIPIEDFGNHQIVDADISSCSEIIADFYFQFKDELSITAEGIKALYTGMVTDTGRFRFDSVTGDTMRTAGALIDLGVNISEIDECLSSENLKTLKLKGYVLSNFQTTSNGFVYITITPDIIKQFDVTHEEAASQVGVISTIEGYPVWCLIIEYPNEIRIRLRSRGPDVDKLANRYGGGGHAKASGGKLQSWDDLSLFVQEADEIVKNYKKDNK